jgi:hypothetical protein
MFRLLEGFSSIQRTFSTVENIVIQGDVGIAVEDGGIGKVAGLICSRVIGSTFALPINQDKRALLTSPLFDLIPLKTH